MHPSLTRTPALASNSGLDELYFLQDIHYSYGTRTQCGELPTRPGQRNGRAVHAY